MAQTDELMQAMDDAAEVQTRLDRLMAVRFSPEARAATERRFAQAFATSAARVVVEMDAAGLIDLPDNAYAEVLKKLR